MSVEVAIPANIHKQLLTHLFQGRVENVAFLLANAQETAGGTWLNVMALYAVPTEGFDRQTAGHVSLADHVRAQVIKWAWDAGACLIETHSHRGPHSAMFSSFDLHGLSEFVPHVWWRLRGRPYAALVFADSSFDGLAWISGKDQVEPVTALVVSDTERQEPTGLTLNALRRASRAGQ